MTVPATTAEWICTRCGATNRKLVALRTIRITDRCVTCHAPHIVEVGERPVRWRSRIDE